MQIYVGAGVVYILINVLLSQVAKLVEKRTRSSARAVGAAAPTLPTGPITTGNNSGL